ncbi:MAG: flagellin [Actinomycetes bacterium]
MRINQNIMAFNAYRNIQTTNTQLGKSLEKLSSGYRINRAADDAAGLAKSESLRAEIRGTQQAIRNAQDGVSWVQTAEGALQEVHSILQRMRQLAVDAANTATTGGAEQQAEFDQLVEELDAIGKRTTFAGKAVFSNYDSGSGGTALTFHVGAGSGADNKLTVELDLTIDVTGNAGIFFGIDDDGDPGTPAVNVNLDALDLTTAADAAIGALDLAIDAVSSVRSELGAKQNRLEHTIANLSVAVENLSASESRIRDTDMAEEMVAFTRHQIMAQAGTAMLAQANVVPQSVLRLLG